MWEVVQAKRAARVPSLLRAREWCLEPDQYGPGPDGKESLVKGVRINAQRMVMQGGREIANLAGRFAREEPLTRGDQDVLQTLNTETEFLVSPPIARDLEKGEWGFSQLREKITTVYIVLPMHQLADKRRWIRVIITAALFAHLKPSPLKTLFILDEFKAAIGDLQIVNQFWALVRGYGVQFMPVCQSILQLKELFKDEWENLAAQAGAVATIGPAGDMATAEWMSKRGGNTSIWAQGWNEGQGINPQQGGMPTSNMGETRSQLARAVMLPQEIMSMKEGTGLIWLSGEGERLFPYYAPNYWDRPELSGLIDDNPMRPGATSSPGAAGSSSPPPSSSAAAMQETDAPTREQPSPLEWVGEIILAACFVVLLPLWALVCGLNWLAPARFLISARDTLAYVGAFLAPIALAFFVAGRLLRGARKAAKFWMQPTTTLEEKGGYLLHRFYYEGGLGLKAPDVIFRGPKTISVLWVITVGGFVTMVAFGALHLIVDAEWLRWLMFLGMWMWMLGGISLLIAHLLIGARDLYKKAAKFVSKWVGTAAHR